MNKFPEQSKKIDGIHERFIRKSLNYDEFQKHFEFEPLVRYHIQNGEENSSQIMESKGTAIAGTFNCVGLYELFSRKGELIASGHCKVFKPRDSTEPYYLKSSFKDGEWFFRHYHKFYTPGAQVFGTEFTDYKVYYDNVLLDDPIRLESTATVKKFHSNKALETVEYCTQISAAHSSWYTDFKLPSNANSFRESFLSNGALKYKSARKNGFSNGPFEYYSDKGKLRKRGTYDSLGDYIDLIEDFYSNGQLKSRGKLLSSSFDRYRRDGEWEFYNEDGSLHEKRYYENAVEVDMDKKISELKRFFK